MSRRPYFDPTIIRDELRAYSANRNDNGYRTHCKIDSVVGMDGRSDWFRWHCRDCESKHISQRSEKRMRYYRCRECSALHFVYRGFFDEETTTEPLTEGEAKTEIEYTELQYRDCEPCEFVSSPSHIEEKLDEEWEVA